MECRRPIKSRVSKESSWIRNLHLRLPNIVEEPAYATNSKLDHTSRVQYLVNGNEERTSATRTISNCRGVLRNQRGSPDYIRNYGARRLSRSSETGQSRSGHNTPRSQHYGVGTHWFRSYLKPNNTVVAYIKTWIKTKSMRLDSVLWAKVDITWITTRIIIDCQLTRFRIYFRVDSWCCIYWKHKQSERFLSCRKDVCGRI